MKTVNLIPRSRRLARQKRTRYRVWSVGWTAYSFVLIVVCMTVYGVRPSADLLAATEELTALENELAELESDRRSLLPELAEQQLILSSSRSISDQPDWSMLLSYLANDLLNEEIVLSACTFEPVEGAKQDGELGDRPLELKLIGYAKSTPAASQFVLRLERSLLFDKVMLSRTQLEPFMNGQAIAFEIVCVVGEKSKGVADGG